MPTTEIITIMPSGGGDYVSLNAAEAGERQDLTSTDKILVFEVYSGGNSLTGELEFSSANWTTDATRYIIIRAADGHEHQGVYDTDFAYGDVNGATTAVIRFNNVAYARFEKFQIRKSDAGGTARTIRCDAPNNNSRYIVDRCIAINEGTGEAVVRFTGGGSGGDRHVVKNSILIQRGTLSSNYAFLGTGSGPNASDTSFFNNTLLGGVRITFGTLTTQNNYIAAQGSQTCYSTGSGFTLNKGANDATNNAEADTPSLRNIAYTTDNFMDVTSGDENLHLVEGSDLIDEGATLTGQDSAEEDVLVDFEGEDRPAEVAYDIGADEFTPPSVDFTADSVSGTVPFNVAFTSINNGPLPFDTLFWEFGDGDTSTDTNPTHEYQTVGVFTVKLTATTTGFPDAVEEKTDYITVLAPPAVDFSVDLTSGTTPLEVQFSNDSNFSATSTIWDFGDPDSGANNVSTLAAPTHTYETPGTYTVSLTASSASVDPLTETKVDFITANVPLPVADFDASPVEGFVPLTVTFTNESTGFPDSFLWDFGDGTTSTDENPFHTYAADGEFTVTLTATNVVGSSQQVAIITVEPVPDLIADFRVLSMNPGSSIIVQFESTATEALAFFWDFGDPDSGISNTSNEESPTHIYDDPGMYQVTLTVTHGPFTDVICKNVLVTLDTLRFQEIWGTAQFEDGTPVDANRVVSVSRDTDMSVSDCGSDSTDSFGSFKTVDDSGTTRFLVRARGNVLDIPDSGFEDNEAVFILIGGRQVTHADGSELSVPFFQTLPSSPESHVELDLVFPLAQTTAMPAGGTFDEPIEVALESNVVPAMIWYTTDGSDPTTSSTRELFVDSVSVGLGTTILKFYTEDPLGPDEPVREEIYIVNPPLVIADPPAGNYSAPQLVTLSGTRNGIIYYQINGTGPFAKYLGETISIDPGPDGMRVTTIKTYLIDTEGNVGPTLTFQYYVDLVNPTIQTFTINNGDETTASQLVTIQTKADSFTNTVTGIMLSTFADFRDAIVQLYAEEQTFSLPAPDGQKIVYVQVFDQFERASLVSNAAIELDTEIPALTVSDGPITPIGETTFAFTGTKSANSGILTKQNGGSEVLIIPIDETTTWEHTVTLIEGTNVIDFQAITAVGNRSPLVTRDIEVSLIPQGVEEATTLTGPDGSWRVPFVFFDEMFGDLQERQHDFAIIAEASIGPDPVVLFPMSNQVLNESVITVSGTAQPGSVITLRVEPT